MKGQIHPGHNQIQLHCKLLTADLDQLILDLNLPQLLEKMIHKIKFQPQ